MIIYNQREGYSNSELTYMVIDGNNEIKSFFYFALCRFNRITKRGVLVQTFYHDVERVWNAYDDEPDYCERTVNNGYALISFDGVYMGAGDDAERIAIGNLYNNPGCDKVYDSTPGVYLVDNDVFIELEGAYRIRLHKERKGDNFTIIVMNNDGMFGMYFNDKKVLDYSAKKIEALDYKLSDFRERKPDSYDEQHSDKESDYFKCITDNGTFIMYDGEIIAENVRDTKFISIICDNQLEVSDYILITTDESCMLFHENEFLYELGFEESIKGSCLMEISSLGLCANLKSEFLYVFSYSEQKFMLRPIDPDDDEYDPYYEEPDYERDTYYALGGNDYDSFRNNGGSIDDMMDGMGL